MEQYIIDFLNTVQYWGITDWTLGHNGPDEPFAYSKNDSHHLIYISNYIRAVDAWMDDPLRAVKSYPKFTKDSPFKALAAHFIQYGAPAYDQYPTHNKQGTPGSINKNQEKVD